jgi:hypothetical protein
MKKYMVILWVASLLFNGCSRHISPPTGSWSADSGAALSIHKDGTFSLKMPTPNENTNSQQAFELSGTYMMVDSSHIRFQPASTNSPVNYYTTNQFSISGDELSLHESGSQVVTRFRLTKVE